MSRLYEAQVFASAAHAAVGQLRKYTGEPYVVHPVEVARILAFYGLGEAVQVAGMLHDVLEDTQVPESLIESFFGRLVLSLVKEVTDVSRPEDGNRAQRKALDRAHLANASDLAQCVKLADCISNASNIVKHDPKFAKVYVAEIRLLLQEMKGGLAPMRAELEQILSAIEKFTKEGGMFHE